MRYLDWQKHRDLMCRLEQAIRWLPDVRRVSIADAWVAWRRRVCIHEPQTWTVEEILAREG